MAVAAGRAERQIDDGVDSARRQDLDRRWHEPRDNASDLVQSYDPQTGAWQSQPSLPIPLHHAAAATYRGEVVVIGGASDKLAQASNKVFALRGGSWVELPSLTHARAAAAAAVVGDKLVVVGGQNEKQLVPQTEVFDGESWKQAADLPTPREHLAAVSDGIYVYTVGGRFLSADKNSAAFERFDPAIRGMDEAGGHADSARQLRRRRSSRPDRGRRWRGTDAGAGHGRDVRHRRGEVDRTARRCRPRVTPRWSPRSAPPCTASAAPTGRHTKVPSRPSRPWTSLNARTVHCVIVLRLRRSRSMARETAPRSDGLIGQSRPDALPRWGYRTCRTSFADAV